MRTASFYLNFVSLCVAFSVCPTTDQLLTFQKSVTLKFSLVSHIMTLSPEKERPLCNLLKMLLVKDLCTKKTSNWKWIHLMTTCQVLLGHLHNNVSGLLLARRDFILSKDPASLAFLLYLLTYRIIVMCLFLHYLPLLPGSLWGQGAGHILHNIPSIYFRDRYVISWFRTFWDTASLT